MKVNSCHIPFLSFTLRFTSGTEVGRNDRHEEWNDEPKDRGTEASKWQAERRSFIPPSHLPSSGRVFRPPCLRLFVLHPLPTSSPTPSPPARRASGSERRKRWRGEEVTQLRGWAKRLFPWPFRSLASPYVTLVSRLTSPSIRDERSEEGTAWQRDDRTPDLTNDERNPAPTGFFILILFTFLSHITTNKKERELMWKGTESEWRILKRADLL